MHRSVHDYKNCSSLHCNVLTAAPMHAVTKTESYLSIIDYCWLRRRRHNVSYWWAQTYRHLKFIFIQCGICQRCSTFKKRLTGCGKAQGYRSSDLQSTVGINQKSGCEKAGILWHVGLYTVVSGVFNWKPLNASDVIRVLHISVSWTHEDKPQNRPIDRRRRRLCRLSIFCGHTSITSYCGRQSPIPLSVVNY